MIDAMRTTLRNDLELAALLPGGILDEPITEKTPGVWITDPITRIKRLRSVAVLLTPQTVAHPFGLNPGRRVDLDLWPDLYVYGERNDIDTIYAAADRALELLHGLRIGLADIDWTGHRGAPLPSDEIPGNVIHIYDRYRVQTVQHVGG